MENSFIPALKESEKFIRFMDKKFQLNLKNYIITINKASKNTIGYFMSDKAKEKFVNQDNDLNNINLNTFYLKSSNPYEVLTHELAHFVNHLNKIKDNSSNQYHNKYFKKQAEIFFLSVEKGKKGYSQTKETDKFKEMLKDFKTEKEVFNIFQNKNDKIKVGSRLKLYICNCGVKVRCAVELNAKCLSCGSNFNKIE